MYDSNIHIENDFMVWFLKRLGFEWNQTWPLFLHSASVTIKRIAERFHLSESESTETVKQYW